MSLFREEITIEGATVLKPMASSSLVKSALIAPAPAPIVTKAPILAPAPVPAPRPVPRITPPTVARPPMKLVARPTSPRVVPRITPPTVARPPSVSRPALAPVSRTAETAVASSPSPSPSKLFTAGGGASASLFKDVVADASAPAPPTEEVAYDDDRGAVGVSIEAPDPIWYAAAAAALAFGVYLWRRRATK